MADQMNPGVVNDPRHNVAARDATVQKAFEKMFALEQDIDAMMDEHVTPLKDELKALKRDLKTDTDIDGKDLTLFYKLFKRQEEAKLYEDDQDRDRVIDNLRAVYEAVGGQLDFVDAIERVDADDDFDEPSAAVLDKAYKAGREAGEKGEDGTANPYGENDPCHTSWANGWTDAQTEMAEGLSGGDPDETEAV